MMEVIKTNGSKIGTALMVVPKGVLRWKRRIFGFGKMMKWGFILTGIMLGIHYLMKAANILMDCEKEIRGTYERIKGKFQGRKEPVNALNSAE